MINYINFHPNGENMASCSKDMTIKLWTRKQGDDFKCYKTLQGHEHEVFASLGEAIQARIIIVETDKSDPLGLLELPALREHNPKYHNGVNLILSHHSEKNKTATLPLGFAPCCVKLRQKDHPIVKGMPAEWKHAKDELYDSLRGPADKVEVIATAYSSKSKRHEPMIMTISYGKGRVFHTPMGHADYSMLCVGFQDVLRRGTEWAVTGKVTQALSKEFPSADKTVSVSAK
jgi:hypothetical protein